MTTFIVYVDDAAYAQPLLQAMLPTPADAPQPAPHCVLVACAPRITHRVSRFASNRARENWRTRWADKLFETCTPALQAAGVQVTTVLARGPLPEVLAQLQAEHGANTQVVDMRRPKMHEEAPSAVPALAPTTLAPAGMLRKLSGTLTAVGALWGVLLSEGLAA